MKEARQGTACAQSAVAVGPDTMIGPGVLAFDMGVLVEGSK